MDFSFKNTAIPTKGSILLSDPFEDDLHFSRSVVFLCTHDELGTFGFVLNNFVSLRANELNNLLAMCDSRVSIGGPVDKENMYYFHRLGADIPNSVHVIGDVYFGGDFEHLIQKLNNDPDAFKNKIRFFIGYSGWEPGQLEEELINNAWLVVNKIDSEVLFDTETPNLWKEIMNGQGRKFELLAQFPINPQSN